MRDYLDIIKRNLLSPIVVVIFLLAGALDETLGIKIADLIGQ